MKFETIAACVAVVLPLVIVYMVGAIVQKPVRRKDILVIYVIALFAGLLLHWLGINP